MVKDSFLCEYNAFKTKTIHRATANPFNNKDNYVHQLRNINNRLDKKVNPSKRLGICLE